MTPLRVAAYTLVNALGAGIQASLCALREGRSGLRPCDFAGARLDTWIGRVEGIERVALPEHLAYFDCRNNRLAYMGLIQDGFSQRVAETRVRYGAHRVGVFVGTSTSGIAETEKAYSQRHPNGGALPESYRYRYTQNTFSVADFTRRFLGLKGPAQAVATACSSSAKVFAVAHRHIVAGLCDAAVVGGVDSLCLTTLHGFNSLELVSRQPCRPWDARRNGISIGEAAGFALLEGPDACSRGIALLGYGESSDAYHISSPHPQGVGARLAIERALAVASLSPADIDYVNVHGTATRANDVSEDRALASVLGPKTICSATKGWTGHCLGAAGITEALFTCLAIEHGFVPGTLNTNTPDSTLSTPLIIEGRECRVKRALSNSFGFGGNNCGLIFGRGN